CSRSADDVEPRRAEQLSQVGVGLSHHAAAEPAAALDLAPGLVTEHILDQERHTTEGSGAELGLVEGVDAVGIELDDGIDRRIGDLDSPARRDRQLLRGYGLARYELGQSQSVVAGVLGNV